MIDNAATPTVKASYVYEPFGRTLSSAGTEAAANTYRFSSKETHPQSGMYYYGYRWYEPNLQRWVNRDPLEKKGGVNLYAFVNGSPINTLDANGLSAWSELNAIHSTLLGVIARAVNRALSQCWKSI
jgi:RHS repeat-associated protein